MNVTIVNTSDGPGGAARAAYRLLMALDDCGSDVSMRVVHKSSTDQRVKAGIPERSIGAKITRRLQLIRARYEARGWSSTNPVLHTFGHESAGVVDELNASSADVLNLHWVSNMLSVRDIGALRKPVVWTLHDMWAFCGGEHYASDHPASRFATGYVRGNRPVEETGQDLDRRTWEAKRRAWRDQRFILVTPSRWMADCARRSVMFSETEVHTIPNAVETQGVWQPRNAAVAREALGLPLQKRLLLMGADGGLVDPRKGGDLLRDAIARVHARFPSQVELVVYGQDRPSAGDTWPCPVHWLGVVRDDRVLSLAYSAADVVLVPSLQDNLPNVAVEAQACGTPVVAFNAGGLPDIVEHADTGWLARPFVASDFADGVCWLLEHEERRRAVARNARCRAVERFSPSVVGTKYLKVFEVALVAARRAGSRCPAPSHVARTTP